jgi:CubicO group peptidase (beta-lactamase class C family)
MDGTRRGAVDKVIGRALADRVFPGIACAVWMKGKLLVERYAGYRNLDPEPEPMGPDTIFDLASLTKPLCTAILLVKAHESEGFPLTERLGAFLPEAAQGTRDIPLASLLTHTGGMPAVPELQRFFPDPSGVDPAEAERRLLGIEPESPVGARVVYSCTGFLLLGLAVARISGKRLDRLFREEIAAPLGLVDAGFAPAPALRARAAPTEFCPWRGRRVRGEVHDESAFCLGGVAGNAGLFATLRESGRIASIFLGEGSAGGARILKPGSVRLMTTVQTGALRPRRAMGFLLHDDDTQDGPAWPEAAFGHTGFTGTSVFADPGRGLLAVALTNRVYFGRSETQDKMPVFRRAFHAAVMEEFGGA